MNFRGSENSLFDDEKRRWNKKLDDECLCWSEKGFSFCFFREGGSNKSQQRKENIHKLLCYFLKALWLNFPYLCCKFPNSKMVFLYTWICLVSKTSRNCDPFRARRRASKKSGNLLITNEATKKAQMFIREVGGLRFTIASFFVDFGFDQSQTERPDTNRINFQWAEETKKRTF